MLSVSYLFCLLLNAYFPPRECNLKENLDFCLFMGGPKHLEHGTGKYSIKMCWVNEKYHYEKIKLRNKVITILLITTSPVIFKEHFPLYFNDI